MVVTAKNNYKHIRPKQESRDTKSANVQKKVLCAAK